MIALLISLLIGPPVPVDGQDGLIILKEPQTYQLEKGADPGSFHFARKNMKIVFSMEPDFPVRLVAEDYAGKEVTSTTINSSKPFDFNIDLPPGSYTIRTKAPAKSKHPYWDSDGFRIHINTRGVVYYAEPPEFSRTFLHPRKIEILSPKNLETLQGKTLYLGWHPPLPLDSTRETFIPTTVVRWIPLRGVSHYVVSMSYLQDPFHPNSAISHEADFDVNGSEFRFPKDEYLCPGGSHSLTVEDVDENGNYGHAGHQTIVVLQPGAEKFSRTNPMTCVGGDEWIDTRTTAKYAQARAVADYDGLNVIVKAIGDGPANNAGLRPDETIYSVNGVTIQTLDGLRTVLEKIPPGGTAIAVAGDYKSKQTLRMTLK